MKTSIIVSSFAALCFLVTLGETTSRRNTENTKITSENNFTYLRTSWVSARPAINLTVNTRKETSVKTSLPSAEDLSYLKFNVADYSDNDKMVPEVTDENSFDYLKFDLSDYSGNNEISNPDVIELPVCEFTDLKFAVNEYIENTELTSFEAIELPESEFDYLKFYVNKFMNIDDPNSSEITELQVDEYSYLKFDVNNYTKQNTTCTDKIDELPVNE